VSYIQNACYTYPVYIYNIKQDTLNSSHTKCKAMQTVFFSWDDIFTRNNRTIRNNTVISFDVTRLHKRESYVYNSRNFKLLYL